MMLIQVLTLFVAIGSSSPSVADVLADREDFIQSVSNDTIALEALSKQAGDSIVLNYYFHGNQLYSGKAVEYEMAPDGRWSFVYSFKNGVMQRLDVFGMNGYRHRFVEMKNGKEVHTIMFHRNGNRYLETFYDEFERPTGTWKRWHDSGELEWEKTYD